MATRRVAVVTGANKGIGFEVAKRLVTEGLTVVLTSRDAGRGTLACQQLKEHRQLQDSDEKGDVVYSQLDINDKHSIATFSSWIKQQHGGLDVLVNNAGIYKDDDPTPLPQQTEPTLDTNYFATVALTDALLPLVRDDGFVVNVASLSGVGALKKLSAPLRAQFVAPSLTREGVDRLANAFRASVKAGKCVEEGWSDTSYGMSKLCVIAWSSALSRLDSVVARRIMVSSCCPGYCNTDMTCNDTSRRLRTPPTRTPSRGALTPSLLASLPPDAPRGGFWLDEKIRNWRDA